MIPMVPVASSGKGDLWMELAGLIALFLLPSVALNIMFVYEGLFALEVHLQPTISLPVSCLLVMFIRWTLEQREHLYATSS
jgi:hypothetical protein